MLRIYPVMLEVLRQLRPVLRRIELRDKDLARQLRRCSVSIALNLAEGMYSRGGNRTTRYHSALGSARETLACLEAAEACGYIAGVDAALLQQLRRVVGTLVKLVAA
ncbi:MAG: four helix bundle protein [Myxococcales bacterium]